MRIFLPFRHSRQLAALTLLALAACSVGPAYRRPVIASPAAWHAADNAVSASWPAADWWRGFGSPQLNELISAAQTSNDDIAAAIARVREADAQARIAGAALLPSLDADAAASRQRSAVPGGGTRLATLYYPALNASYALDFWGKNRAARDAARASAAASRYDRVTVTLTVTTAVASTYFQALELRDRLGIAEQNLANATTILKGLQLEQTTGTTTGLDTAQQETTVAVLNAAISPLRQQFDQTLNTLAILIGRPPESLDIATGTLDDLSQLQVDAGIPSELLTRRPDVAEAEAQLIAANADIVVARATLFPNIVLTAGGGFESSALSGLLSPANRVYSVAAGLTQPIFHGGALWSQYTYSQARYAELLAGYHKTVITAFGNVENALIAVEQSSQQLQRQQDAVNKARRAFEFAQAQMRSGTVNILTVLNTETALFTAQDTLVQVKFAHLQALISLYGALGGGWER